MSLITIIKTGKRHTLDLLYSLTRTGIQTRIINTYLYRRLLRHELRATGKVLLLVGDGAS
jgi:hypothetical protein